MWDRRLEDPVYRFQKERDEARAQLAAAHARIAVLEAALREVAQDDDPRDGCAHSAPAKAVLANSGPLAAAVGQVIGAARDWHASDRLKHDLALRDAVHDLEALAPWWPT